MVEWAALAAICDNVSDWWLVASGWNKTQGW
jgi:hypothetical protein